MARKDLNGEKYLEMDCPADIFKGSFSPELPSSPTLGFYLFFVLILGSIFPMLNAYNATVYE